ncbi:MAG TPA: hypothetical protein VF516_47920 [Kofleriaceae bacterium]
MRAAPQLSDSSSTIAEDRDSRGRSSHIPGFAAAGTPRKHPGRLRSERSGSCSQDVPYLDATACLRAAERRDAAVTGTRASLILAGAHDADSRSSGNRTRQASRLSRWTRQSSSPNKIVGEFGNAEKGQSIDYPGLIQFIQAFLTDLETWRMIVNDLPDRYPLLRAEGAENLFNAKYDALQVWREHVMLLMLQDMKRRGH